MMWPAARRRTSAAGAQRKAAREQLAAMQEAHVRTRKAILPDVEHIHGIIRSYSGNGTLLPRTLAEMCENMRDFVVVEDDGQIIGCGALHLYGMHLAEIRSIAVCPRQRAGRRPQAGGSAAGRSRTASRELRLPVHAHSGVLCAHGIRRSDARRACPTKSTKIASTVPSCTRATRWRCIAAKCRKHIGARDLQIPIPLVKLASVSDDPPQGFLFLRMHSRHQGQRQTRPGAGRWFQTALPRRPCLPAIRLWLRRSRLAATICAKHKGMVRAVIVNAGNANCATGKPGLKAAKSVCAGLAAKATDQGPPSTRSSLLPPGLLACRLPVEKIHAALPGLIVGGSRR